jgi:hypothetical protein
MKSQVNAVRAIMATGAWMTFRTIQDRARYTHGVRISEAGVSARIRDLRKAQYGGFTVLRRSTGAKGIFEYRLVLPGDDEMRPEYDFSGGIRGRYAGQAT